MASPEMVELGKKLFDLKSKKEVAEEALTEINKEITAISTGRLAELMTNGEVPSFKIDGLGTISMKQELYVSVLADDRAKLHEWLRAEKCGDLIKESVAPQSLKAFCKERLQNGKPLPEAVKATVIPTAGTRKK